MYILRGTLYIIFLLLYFNIYVCIPRLPVCSLQRSIAVRYGTQKSRQTAVDLDIYQVYLAPFCLVGWLVTDEISTNR